MSGFASTATVVVVDNVDPDNLAAALAAARLLDVKAVIVTGRPANPNPKAANDDAESEMTAAVHALNTARMKGFLRRNGVRCPVFQGLVAPHTLVSHRVHIDEHELDVARDGSNSKMRADGLFEDALVHLKRQRGSLNVVVGGPMTEVAVMLGESRLASKLGMLTAQFGAFGFGDVELMAGGRRQFNVACDPTAADVVLRRYPNRLYMVPTDITKAHEAGFGDPAELVESHVCNELVEVYRRAYPKMLAPRGERIYLHDVHPVLLMAQLLELVPVAYECSSAEIVKVPHISTDRPHWGEIDIRWSRSVTRRWVVTRQNVGVVRQLFSTALASRS
ncbi:MAG TPA: nucleoside hydrolase [Candidatus Saccharimonadales bacterium]|nr:nucleoside hydrolase [Candidatus Saccharimonadales bacterium]